MCPRIRAWQREKPLQWEAFLPQLENIPHLPQLEKAYTQQQRPSAAKKFRKWIKKFFFLNRRGRNIEPWADGLSPYLHQSLMPGPPPCIFQFCGSTDHYIFCSESFVLCSLQEKFLLKTSCNKGEEPTSRKEVRTGMEKPQSWNARTVSPVGTAGSQRGQMQDPNWASLWGLREPCPAGPEKLSVCTCIWLIQLFLLYRFADQPLLAFVVGDPW